MYVHAYQSRVWNRLVSERVQRHGATRPVAGDLIEQAPGVYRALSADEAEKYRMDDVVMPMPGTDVHIPEGSWQEQMYADVLAEDGLTPQSLGASKQPYVARLLQHTHPSEYRLKGAYRKIVQTPSAVDAALIPYSDADEALCTTDEEELVDALRAKHGMHRISEVCEGPRDADAPLLAMRLMFALPSSSYATVLLRELFRTDMSSHAQKQLTKQAQS